MSQISISTAQTYPSWTTAELHLRTTGQDNQTYSRPHIYKRGLRCRTNNLESGRTQEGSGLKSGGTFKIKQESAGLKLAVVEDGLAFENSRVLSGNVTSFAPVRHSWGWPPAGVTSSSHVSSFTYFEPERFQNQPNGSIQKVITGTFSTVSRRIRKNSNRKSCSQ